jgi:dolichol-phosphate mannosyltransferase
VLFLLDSRSRQFDSIGLVFFAGLTTRLALPLRFAAFVLVGGFCLTANTLLLWALTEGLGTHYLVSTVIAFAAITPLGFLLNKVITFRTRREYARIELPRYFVAMAASFAANLALMYLLVSALGVWYLAASLVVAVILVVLNFLTSDRWSFRV